jgi:predicted permease
MVSGLSMLLLGFIVHILLALIAFLITKPFKDKYTGRILEHCIVFGNVGFFGIPVVREVFGPIGAFYAGFFIISFNMMLWSYGLFVLSRSGRSMNINVKKIFLNAGTIPCTIGLILFFSGLKIYTPIIDGMKMIGDACTPLSMIIIGSMIARIPLKRILFRWQPYFVCLIKLIIAPVIVGAVLKLLGFSDTFTIFGSIMVSFPSASATAMFAQKNEIQPELAAQTVRITTILSVITVPLVMQAVKFVVKLI